MTITHPGAAGASVQHDASEAASRALATVSIGAVAPESYAGQLRCQERLIELARTAFERVRPDAAAIAAAARSDVDDLRRDELRTDPFARECFSLAARSIEALPAPLDPGAVKAAVAALITEPLAVACREVDRNAASRLKTQKRTERKRRRLKAEIDAFGLRLRPLLADHISGLIRDDIGGELARRDELGSRARAALRRLCAEAVDPGDDIPGSHRFSCGPRVEVVLKAVAVQRPDLLDRVGRPTDAIWAAFGTEVAAGDLGVMEDPHEAIAALRRFLESTVTQALHGLTLDALYTLTREPPETPNWIGRSAARLQTVTREEPYRVRLAQVPAAAGDTLYDQILHHIQTATRSDDGNRLQLVELTYAFCAEEVLRSDPRGMERVLASIQSYVSNPRLAVAIGAQLAAMRAGRGSVPLEPRLSANGVAPEIMPPHNSDDAPVVGYRP